MHLDILSIGIIVSFLLFDNRKVRIGSCLRSNGDAWFGAELGVARRTRTDTPKLYKYQSFSILELVE